MRAARHLTLVLLTAGCTPWPIPRACETLCAARTDLQSQCLPEYGWNAYGFEDADEYEGSCQAWAWATIQLERDAGEPGATESFCEAVEPTLQTCDDLLAVDWQDVPWSIE